MHCRIEPIPHAGAHDERARQVSESDSCTDVADDEYPQLPGSHYNFACSSFLRVSLSGRKPS